MQCSVGTVDELSHISLGPSRRPLPQEAAQSESVEGSAPLGQQPSLFVPDAVSRFITHSRVQLVPCNSLYRQLSPPFGQEVGQEASHFSPGSVMAFPHMGEQSESVVASAPSGQQPSFSTVDRVSWRGTQ